MGTVATGEKVQFRRDNNVYRLGVSVTTGDFSLAGSATPVSPSHELFANDDDDQEDSERDVVFESQEKAEDELSRWRNMNLLIFHIDLGARHVCRGDHVIGSTEGSIGEINSKSLVLCSTTASLVERVTKKLWQFRLRKMLEPRCCSPALCRRRV